MLAVGPNRQQPPPDLEEVGSHRRFHLIYDASFLRPRAGQEPARIFGIFIGVWLVNSDSIASRLVSGWVPCGSGRFHSVGFVSIHNLISTVCFKYFKYFKYSKYFKYIKSIKSPPWKRQSDCDSPFSGHIKRKIPAAI